MKKLKLILLFIFFTSLFASPISESLDSGDDIYLLLNCQYADSTSEMQIIPLFPGNDGLMIAARDLPIIELRSSTQSRNLSNLVYQEMPDGFIMGDYKKSMNSRWENPGIYIDGADGSLYIFNIATKSGDAFDVIGHTRFAINEVFDVDGFDLRNGNRYEYALRPELSSIEIQSHFVFAKTDDGIAIKIAKDPVTLYSSSLYRDDDGFMIGQSQDMSLAFYGNLGRYFEGDIYLTPENLITYRNCGNYESGYSFEYMTSIKFGRNMYNGAIPQQSEDSYEYPLEISTSEIDEIPDPIMVLDNSMYIKNPVIPSHIKEHLGLAIGSDDADGDGLSDYMEILMASDPLDAYTEDFDYDDKTAYLKKGMLPPRCSFVYSDPDTVCRPKVYQGDITPGSFFRLGILRKANTPMALKIDKLIRSGHVDEARVLRDRAVRMHIYERYGEAALFEYEELIGHPLLMIFHEDWPSWYGDADTDLDGIPDELEDRGWLFGGLGFDDYGSHYWDRLNTLAAIFPAGYEGVIIGSYIYYDSGLDLNCIKTHYNMFDTDMDGLCDYFEYLWHSCPLLVHSDWSPGAKNDHEKIFENFQIPRADWVSSWQDIDGDGIPNGAEIFFMMDVLGAQLDESAWSTDWDQYSDLDEWKSWWYKDGSYPFPLDDPLPYVVRNGCHPLIPAYPQVTYLSEGDVLRLPYNDIVSTARGLHGDMTTSAEMENGSKGHFELKMGFIPWFSMEATCNMTAKATNSITNAWDMTSSTTYDYSQGIVLNKFKVRNIGTEPTDLNPYGDEYYCQYVDIQWPGNPEKRFLYNQRMGNADDLPPFMDGESDWADERFITLTNTLSDVLGMESTIGEETGIPELAAFDGAYYTGLAISGGLNLLICAAPGIAFAPTKIALMAEFAAGVALIETYYDLDLYRNFVDCFEKSNSMDVVQRTPPVYNTGESGIFSPDNPCDWTSILAAHRNYCTIICTYPGESPLGNLIKESPIKPESDRESPGDSIYTLEEFIGEYAGIKIEEFFWGEGIDTLYQVGCYPNVGYGDTVVPETSPTCDTLDSYGKWIIISSVDTITEPHRADDFCITGTQKFIGGDFQLAKGDIFILYYLKDSDADSLEDQLEFAFGTNPYDPDTDNDDLWDDFEIEHGLDPLNANSDNSFYDAFDGEEWFFLTESEGSRERVGLPDGDTIETDRDDWDDYLLGSPRETDEHRDFVPYPYSAGGYNAENDDKYMDFNTNGVPDWRETWFQNPQDMWNGRFMITWDGEQTLQSPWGFQDNLFEVMKVDYHALSPEHLSRRIETDPSDSSGCLEFIFSDVSGTNDIWDNSYGYFQLFNCEIPVSSDMELSYDFYPINAQGKLMCIDLLFEDGFRSISVDSFYDVDGVRMHPAWRPFDGDDSLVWHKVTTSLERFTDKTIIAILFGYEDNPNIFEGMINTRIDNLSIRTKNLLFDFDPERAPPDGFLTNHIIENLNGSVLGPDGIGDPVCYQASLPTAEPPYPAHPVLDTMLYGPRDSLLVFEAFLDPWIFDDGREMKYSLAFSILPEKLDYRIDKKTTLGYYIYHEYAPILHWDRDDLNLIIPKTVVDLIITSEDGLDSVYLYDYAASTGDTIIDQFGSAMLPELRNEIDSDSNNTFRPPTGQYWRYIDVQLPDDLEGWYVQNIVIRYAATEPYAGKIKCYIDNITLFERPEDVYHYTYSARQNFGDEVKDYYDDNDDDIVDWESVFIHHMDIVGLYSDYAKYEYAGLLKDNFIPEVIDSEFNANNPWVLEFAVDTTDTSYKWPNTEVNTSIYKSSLLNIDTLSVATWNNDGTPIGEMWGYMSRVNGDIADHSFFHPKLKGYRLDTDGGIVKITARDTATAILLDVEPAVVCENQCLVFTFEAFEEFGNMQIGLMAASDSSITWLDDLSDSWMSYRYDVVDYIDAGDSVIGIWLKSTEPGTVCYFDNVSVKRAFYASFEVDEDITYRLFDHIEGTRNVETSSDVCNDTEAISGIIPAVGSQMLMSKVTLNGFSPAAFTHKAYRFFDEPDESDMSISRQSIVSYKVYHKSDITMTRGRAILDLELYHNGETFWISEERLPFDDGGYWTMNECDDPMNIWVEHSIDLPDYLYDEIYPYYIKSIAVRYHNNTVRYDEDITTFIDEVIITF